MNKDKLHSCPPKSSEWRTLWKVLHQQTPDQVIQVEVNRTGKRYVKVMTRVQMKPPRLDKQQ